jgi:hypothetical protein
MKAGNSLEEKIKVTLRALQWSVKIAKSDHACEGTKFI